MRDARARWWGSSLAGLAGLVGCAAEGDGAGNGAPDPEETRAALAGYEGWSQTPTWTGVQPSESAHGGSVQIWWNDEAFSAFEAGDTSLPDGAILVKEAHAGADGGEVTATTAMHKIPEYGWFWVQFEGQLGEVAESGQPSGCTGCHAAGADSVLSEALGG